MMFDFNINCVLHVKLMKHYANDFFSDVEPLEILSLVSYVQHLESEVSRLQQLLERQKNAQSDHDSAGDAAVTAWHPDNGDYAESDQISAVTELPPETSVSAEPDQISASDAEIPCADISHIQSALNNTSPLLTLSCTDIGTVIEDDCFDFDDEVVCEIVTAPMLNSKYSFGSLSVEHPKMVKHLTGFSIEKFNVLYTFLVPGDCQQPFTYKENLAEIASINLKDQLLLTLCRLRQGYTLTDIGHRFNICAQTAGIIITSWVDYMFLRFGSLSIWPHRDKIIQNMPQKYREEFPTTLAIIDCTELPIQRPSSLHLQSQSYSDYKSCNTVKGLLAIDPRGSVIFISKLFSGSISDKEITEQSGFLSLMEQLMSVGKLQPGDAIMADKGFDTNKELESIGLNMNIPPKARSGFQMSQGNVELTKTIAAHRVHVERAIARIKSFKLVGRKIPASIFHNLNQIWFVCAFLTNFQDWLIAKNDNVSEFQNEP